MNSNNPDLTQDFQLLLEEVPTGIGVVNFDGIFLYVNGPYSRMLGYSQEELIGTSFLDITEEKDKQHGVDRLNLMNKEGITPITFKKKYIHKNGHIINARITTKTINIRDELMLLFSVQEVEDEKYLSSTKISDVVNQSTIGVFNVSGTIVRTWNRGAFEIYGYHPDEIIGMDVSMLIPEKDHRAFEASMEAIRRGKKVESPEAIRITKDGKQRSVNESLHPLYNENHELVGFTTITYDVTSKLRLREELERKASTVESLMKGTIDIVLGVNREFKIETINQVRQGYRTEDVIGTDVLNFVAEKDRPIYAQGLERTFEGQSQNLEVMSYGDNMEPALYSVRMNPIRRSDGKIGSALIQATDITQIRQANKKLEESNKRYRAVYEQSYQAIYFFDVESQLVVDHNEKFAETLGYPGDRLIGKSIHDFVYHPKTSVDQQIERIKKGKSVRIGERQWRHKSGKILDMLILGTYLQFDNSQILAVVGQDVTELRTSQRSVNELADIVQHASDPIIVLNPDGTSKFWNPKALELFGYAEDEVTGESILILTPSSKMEESKQLLNRLKSGESIENFVTLREKKGGEQIAISLTSFPILNDKNEIDSFASILRDIRPEQSQRQKVMLALFEGEESERKRIAQGLHDGLGQQLSALSLCMSLVEKDVEPKMYERISKLAEGCIQEYRAVTHNLIPPALRSQGLVPAMKQIVENLKESVNITVEIKGSSSIKVEQTVQTELFRIFQELLNNTIRHSQASNLKILLEETNKLISMTFADDGIGFNPQSEHNTGLGLGNIATRIEIYGGELEIRTAPGNGTTIIVSMKRAT